MHKILKYWSVKKQWCFKKKNSALIICYLYFCLKARYKRKRLIKKDCNFRSKLFIRMFACHPKDMIIAQFSILILLVLLKYQRFYEIYFHQCWSILTFKVYRSFIKLSSPEQVFIMLESLFTLYDDTLVGDSMTACVNDPIKIGLLDFQ